MVQLCQWCGSTVVQNIYARNTCCTGLSFKGGMKWTAESVQSLSGRKWCLTMSLKSLGGRVCGPFVDVQGPWRIQGSYTGSRQWPYYIQDWIGSVEQSLIRIPYPDIGQYGDPEGEPGFRLLAGREGLGVPGNKIISITSTRCIHRKCVCWCMNSWIISSIQL